MVYNKMFRSGLNVLPVLNCLLFILESLKFLLSSILLFAMTIDPCRKTFRFFVEGKKK